jgi:hypothetical protein
MTLNGHRPIGGGSGPSAHARMLGLALSPLTRDRIEILLAAHESATGGTNQPLKAGRACPFCPGISGINLFRYCQRVINLDAEIPDCFRSKSLEKHVERAFYRISRSADVSGRASIYPSRCGWPSPALPLSMWRDDNVHGNFRGVS